MSYTDPAFVPYCYAPFSPPAAGAKARWAAVIGDESAWFHGADGTRVRRYVDATFSIKKR